MSEANHPTPDDIVIRLRRAVDKALERSPALLEEAADLIERERKAHYNYQTWAGERSRSSNDMTQMTNRELYLLTECMEWQSCGHSGCKARREIARLTRERDEYKTWWERDGSSLSKVLNQLSLERACKEDMRASRQRLLSALEQIAWHPKNAYEIAQRALNGEPTSAHETSGQLRASEWARENNAAVTDEWMRGWDACLVANRIPLTTRCVGLDLASGPDMTTFWCSKHGPVSTPGRCEKCEAEKPAARAEGRCETRMQEASGRVFRCTSWAGHPGGCQEWELEPGAVAESPEKASPELAPVYQRKCARCGKMAASTTPEGVGVYYCSIECAD